jgi:mannose-6-phosphate isomerase-like protein (cupin superfamily)
VRSRSGRRPARSSGIIRSVSGENPTAEPDALASRRLSAEVTTIAPDGSDVRVLVATDRGSMAHFALAAGRTSFAVRHRTVEEIWFVIGGHGEMWRKRDPAEGITALETGVSVVIPVGTSFQFRSLGPGPLAAVAVTMPPWPGPDEAEIVDGCADWSSIGPDGTL